MSRPVAIFRHARSEGPGHLAAFLDARGIPWRLIRIDAGDAVPACVREYAGLVFMGGPMSVHDDLPWIAPVLALIRGAVGAGIPVLGHCLGGQLMARALDGTVGPNPVKEIGWGEVTVAGSDQARLWFGDVQHFTAFHWHGETFSVPPGASPLLSSAHCPHQAFAIGPHLALQCHVEMTAAMVEAWCRLGAKELREAAASPGVQPAAEILRDLPARVAALNARAAAIYDRWAEGLRGG